MHLNGSQYMNDPEDDADLRREERLERARANWRCGDPLCSGGCLDCQEHQAQAEEASTKNNHNDHD